MTQKELKQWLMSLRTSPTMNLSADLKKNAEKQEKGMIDWILDALRQTSHTFNVEKYEKEVACKDRSLNDVLTLVAYSLPDLPKSLRHEKPLFFNVDMEEFFNMSDKEWEEYRKKNFTSIEKLGYVEAIKNKN